MRKLLTPRNLALIVGVLVLTIGSAILLRVPLPTIVLAAEKVTTIAGFPVTNTLIATLVADITIIVLAVLATRKMKDIPAGLQNIVEWFVEIFYNMTEEISGKVNAKNFFKWFMTILIFLLIANWWELVPGVDSIGKIEPLEVAYVETGVKTGYKTAQVLGITTLTSEAVTLTPEQIHEIEAEQAAAAEGEHGEAQHHESAVGAYVLVPYMRAAATDLNVPLALALISVLFTQVIGVQALGLSYFRKFLAPPMTGMKILGIPLIDIFVGLLELISEFAKIISFTFRLFGNIFAGAILLFVMTFLIPFFVPLPFYALEVFVGFMQAFVFAILTLIFMSMAVVGHEHEGEHH